VTKRFCFHPQAPIAREDRNDNSGSIGNVSSEKRDNCCPGSGRRLVLTGGIEEAVNLTSAVKQAAQFAKQKDYKTILLIRPQPSGLVSSTRADTAI